MRTKLDKQPRRASKADVSADKLHPASDMGKRAKGGDKFNSQEIRKPAKASGPQSTPAKKPSR